MNHETSHATHSNQHSEHDAWMADCHHWHLEHERASATLGLVQAHLDQHDAQVSEHEFLIGGHEHANQVQEALMAKAEQGAGADASAEGDAFLAKVHAQQAERHKALRARHLALMSHIRAIEKLMAAEG